MRKLTYILFFICQFSTAATYYVKSDGGLGSGLDDANAWSYAKLNSTTLAAGDTVLFKCGDVFFGSFSTYSGTDGNPTIYGAYGSGENPVFTGFVELDSWTLESGNIYYAALDVPRLNMVLLDDVIQGMGRYPNTGYLEYTGHTDNTSITGTTIGAIPFDPSGGEVVIRKFRWIVDRQDITSRSSNTLNYTATAPYGNNNAHSPVDGNGYFIQNHLYTIDQEGDWFYDDTTNRLYMHFGASRPSDRIVKAASIEKNIISNSRNYVNLSNLTIEGANIIGLDISYAGNINVTNCKIISQGGDALYGIQGGGDVTIDNLIVENALNNGIFAQLECDNWTIINSTVTNTQTIAGMGKSGDVQGNGIYVDGDTAIISNNTVTNSGFNGIAVNGNDGGEINNNVVNTFCTIKDDGGGIYMYKSENVIIDSNKVYNAIGACEGAEAYPWEPWGKAAGIYLDGYLCDNIVITNNYFEGGEWGGLLINGTTGSVDFNHNILKDFDKGIYIYLDIGHDVNELNLQNNEVLDSSEYALYIENLASYDMGNLGVFDNNIYNHESSTKAIFIHNNYSGGVSGAMSLKEWQSTFGLDSSSISYPRY